MKYFTLLLIIPFVISSCATYNDREFAEVYNADYRPYIEKPFDDMVERANQIDAEGYGLDGKDAMKAVVKSRTEKQEDSFVNEGITINLGE